MRKNIQLNIPDPCHESWDKMLPAEKGKFCNACQKDVIDFTAMSDAQLVAFFRRPATDSICGRFMQDQLNREIAIPKKRIPWVKYFFQFLLPAFLASSKISAQGKVLSSTNTVAITRTKKDKIQNTIQENQKTIVGKVMDASGRGIPYASVVIKETAAGTATDSVGNFSLNYKGFEDHIVLVSSCVGFQSAEVMIKLNEMKEPLTINLSLGDNLGEVVVVSSVQSRVLGGVMGGLVIKRTFFDELRDTIFPSKKLFTLYPNPIRKNSTLTIDIKNIEGGLYSFRLVSVNGQLLLNKEQVISKSENIIKLDIPTVSAGVYFLQMTNNQTRKKQSEKIIIE